MGLGVATMIITVLAISLFLTIRKIERRQEAHMKRSQNELSNVH
jgi:preprotein translocase subunit YajC